MLDLRYPTTKNNAFRLILERYYLSYFENFLSCTVILHFLCLDVQFPSALQAFCVSPLIHLYFMPAMRAYIRRGIHARIPISSSYGFQIYTTPYSIIPSYTCYYSIGENYIITIANNNNFVKNDRERFSSIFISVSDNKFQRSLGFGVGKIIIKQALNFLWLILYLHLLNKVKNEF